MTNYDLAEKLLSEVKAIQNIIALSESHVGKPWVCEVCKVDDHEMFVRHLAHLISCEVNDHEEQFKQLGEMDSDYYKSAFDNAANSLEIKAELSELSSELSDYILSNG